MNKQDITEQIESYLSGEMTGETLKQFDQKIKSDQELAIQVELYRNIDAALIDDGAFALQQQTDALGDDFFGTSAVEAKPTKFKVYRRYWAIAATVLLLIVGGWGWWSANETVASGAELFASYYEAPVFSNTVRGDDPQADYYVQAVEAYRVNDFAKAEQLFQRQMDTVPTDIRASFGIASVYLQQEPPVLVEATRYFQVIIEDGESLFVDRSKWYLTLIYLKQENKRAAQLLLEELLASEDKQLAKQAKSLLEDM